MQNHIIKVVKDYEKLARVSQALKDLGHIIVVTIGSWDMLHIGHLRYLNNAKSHGDILIVGSDSDRAVRIYKKSDLRPMIPEKERMEMLSYQSCVDFVTIIDDVDENGAWQYGLVKAIQPDVFIAVEDSYPPDQIMELKKFCKEVIILPRQAETSTSAIIQKAVKEHLMATLALLEKR